MILLVILAATMVSAAPPATPERSGIQATFRDGAITTEEFGSWQEHRRESTRKSDASSKSRSIEELVILRDLVDRFHSLDLGRVPGNAARLELKKWEISEHQLRRSVVQSAKPSQADIKKAFEADPERFARQRMWRLENILKKWPETPSQEKREALVEEMAQIRQRIVEGEDFGALARRESQSQTRLRGGRLGLASLDELQPAVAKIVSEMKKGSLSPVLETREGLTLLRCTQVFEAKEGTLSEARDVISNRLRKERVDREWATLDHELLARLKPVYHPEVIASGASPETAVITLRKEGHKEEITLGQYRAFLARTPVDESTIDDVRHLELFEARVLLEARADEARRRGLTADEQFVERLTWTELELKARIALDHLAIPLVQSPTQEDFEALYSRRKAELFSPEQLHLRALEMPIDQRVPRGRYDQFNRLGAMLAAGETSLEAAAEALFPDATVQDLGWMTMDQVWMMGRNTTDAIERLEVGGFAPPVQEGQVLRIFELVGRRDQRTLSLAEARPRLETALISARRRQAEETVRKTILTEQEIEVMQ